MFIDTHAHLYDEKIESVEEFIFNAKEFSVEKIGCCGANIQNSKKSVEIAENFDEVFAIVGVHPDDTDSFDEQSEEILSSLAKSKSVKAIGEIGLDYYHNKNNKERQKEVFEKQIILAEKLGLPIVLHCREATGDMIEILKKHKTKIQNKTVLHCFNKNKEIAKILLEMGVCFSVGGCLTFPNTEKLKEAISIIPLEKIMLETDAPYMSPVPFRGRVNNSKNVKIVAEEIAKIKGLSVEEVEKTTTKNAIKFFGLEEE